ncbi:hypothetical protein GW17_00031364 [Ensete ventricosum]|nr:hypothetical protein GW17_00031364 [Ensete ventricosum]RZR77933.1 hypothetical protein BHM03_00003142 [Ensete ventricosum]
MTNLVFSIRVSHIRTKRKAVSKRGEKPRLPLSYRPPIDEETRDTDQKKEGERGGLNSVWASSGGEQYEKHARPKPEDGKKSNHRFCSVNLRCELVGLEFI